MITKVLCFATWSIINNCYLAACIGCIRIFVRWVALSLQLLISEIFAFELDFTTGCAFLNWPDETSLASIDTGCFRLTSIRVGEKGSNCNVSTRF